MAPFQRPNRLFLLVIFCFSTVLAACSSGGGKGHSSPAPSDSRPDSFVITAPDGVSLENVPFNTPITSAPVTIEGIDTAAPVSITDGEFRINNGTFASTNATVRNGETITVRVQSPVKAGKSATATLNVGGVTASFTVTTGPDTTPPEVTILFPPPASMTEGEKVFVRGIVKDLNGTLADTGSLLVNDIVAEVTFNEAMDEGVWQVEVALEDGVNTLQLTAEDSAGNVSEDASISVTKAHIADAFPSDEVPLVNPIGVTVSVEQDRSMIFLTDPSTKSIISVDMQDGSRRSLSDNLNQAENPFVRPWRLTKGSSSNLYVTDRGNGSIYEVDAQTGVRTILALQDTANKVKSPGGIAYSSEYRKLYVAHGLSIFSVDPATGDVFAVADYSDSSTEDHTFSNIFDLTIDEDQSRLIATDYGSGEFALVGFPSGDVEVITLKELHYVEAIAFDSSRNHTYVADASNARVLRLTGPLNHSANFIHLGDDHAENALVEPWGVAIAPNMGFAVIADPGLKAVLAVDIETGKRVVISKSENQ